jgi:hypothetical protein
MDYRDGCTGCILLAIIWLGFGDDAFAVGRWMGVEDLFSCCRGIMVIWPGPLWSASVCIRMSGDFCVMEGVPCQLERCCVAEILYSNNGKDIKAWERGFMKADTCVMEIR